MEDDQRHQPIPFPQLKFEMSLVDGYRAQQGEPAVPVVEAHALYLGCVLNIEILLATDEGRDALLPLMVRRPNSGTALDARRPEVAERLAILFDRQVTVLDVARAQDVTPTTVRRTLDRTFRSLAVVERQQPQLLESVNSPAKRFNVNTIWPALTTSETERAPEPVPLEEVKTLEPVPPPELLRRSSLSGVGDERLRARLRSLFSGLEPQEQVALVLTYGLDGGGIRNYHEVGARLSVSQKAAELQVRQALIKLRALGGIASLSRYLQVSVS